MFACLDGELRAMICEAVGDLFDCVLDGVVCKLWLFCLWNGRLCVNSQRVGLWIDEFLCVIVSVFG